MPVPAEQAGVTCANCGAALVSDQRYCLECGQPCSPVRLAFLDVLQAEQSPAAIGQGTIEMVPAEYRSAANQQGVSGWLRRNSGLLGLLGVLLLCLLVGLLVGHWVSQGSAPGKQVVEVKGLSVGPAAAAATTTPTSTTPTTTTTTTPAPSKASSKAKTEETKEKAQEAKIEKTPLPAPVKASSKTLSTNPKKHEEEVNSLGDQPIETG
jgi:hypothetical protein